MTAINLAEALDVLERVGGFAPERIDEAVWPLVEKAVEVVAVDAGLARAAARTRARRYHRTRSPLSLADCVLLAAAGPEDTVHTADRPLERAARAEGIAVTRLPR